MEGAFLAKEKGISRRAFVKGLSLFGTALGVSSLWSAREAEAQGVAQVKTNAAAINLNAPYVHSAPEKWWRVGLKKQISCRICPHHCVLPDSTTGFCRTHINRDGKLYTTAWANPCLLEPAPLEQAPLYHMSTRPDTRAMYVATGGCMLRCEYCEVYQFSQPAPMDVPVVGTDWSPHKVTEYTRKAFQRIPGLRAVPLRTIVFGYTEPVAFYEYMLEIAKQAKKVKRDPLDTVMVSSAYIDEGPLKETLPYIDAYVFALKAFTDGFYVNRCHGARRPVLDAMKIIKAADRWIEIATVIVPDGNDGPADIDDMCNWILDNLGPDTPLHFAALMPKWKMSNMPRTSVPRLEACRNLALETGLRYVYIDNVPGHDANNTWCPECKSCLIRRIGVKSLSMMIDGEGRCKKCKFKLPGIWRAA